MLPRGSLRLSTQPRAERNYPTRLTHWDLPTLAGLRLVETKAGPNQFVRISDPYMLQILPSYVAARRSEVGIEGQLFPLQYETLRKTFHRALQWLRLDAQGFTLHSLRHGGATHDSLHGRPIDDIIRPGRWSDPKSAKTYLQTGRALLLSVTIPPLPPAVFYFSKLLSVVCCRKGGSRQGRHGHSPRNYADDSIRGLLSFGDGLFYLLKYYRAAGAMANKDRDRTLVLNARLLTLFPFIFFQNKNYCTVPT